MRAAPSTEGRRGLTAFRLSSIPLAVRKDVGHRLVRAASDDGALADAVALTRAIEDPSETVYWVPTDAYERARARARWTT